MHIYQPAEDSLFLCEIVKAQIKNKNINVLDMGTGSGIQSENLIKLEIPRQNILAVDINSNTLKKAKQLGVRTLKSNLFENIKDKFDLIIFNPPYLPKHKYDSQPDTTGGKKGSEVIIRFINHLKKYLTKNGRALLLTSSITPNSLKTTAKENKLKVRKISTKNLFFERLIVWSISQ